MSRIRVFAVVVVTLIVIGLLAVGGAAIYRAGWSHGYVNGRAIESGDESGEEGPAVAEVPFGFSHRGRAVTFGHPVYSLGFSFLRGGLACLFGLGLFFLLLLALVKLLSFKAWRMACGPMGAPGPGHWHRSHPHPHPHPHPHGGAFPWCWHWEKPPEEGAGPAEPGSQTGDAEAES